jgi:transcriptional regulator with XRE-family HTH domain
VDISKSAVSHWKNGSTPRAEIIKSMADFFNVSPEYIANGNKAPVTNADAICVPCDSDPVAVINGKKRKLSEQEVAVLQLCKELDVVQKAKLLAYASELGS